MADEIEKALDAVTEQLAAATRRQHEDQDPAHEDFYIWGWTLTEVLDRVDQVASVLARQVTAYGDRRILRDDEGVDPAQRLAEAVHYLDTTRAALVGAREQARLYHSAIGHVGVEVDPEATS